MTWGSAPRFAIVIGAAVVAGSTSGCARGPDDTYGTSRGQSVNGTSVLAGMLKRSGHEVRAAIRLSDELEDWAGGIIRFAPYPGPPALEEAAWYRAWLAGDSDRWLIYVVRDFDTVAEYWKNVGDHLPEPSEPGRKADADERREAAADWVAHLPPKAKPPADSQEWFEVDTAWLPPRACKTLTGPWAKGVDPAAAELLVHEPLKPGRGLVLLEGDGKPLVVEKTIGDRAVLVIANGSFLLNEAIVNPARRPLAERVLDWANRGPGNVALVEGSSVFGGGEGMPTLWDLLRRIVAFRWVAFQVGMAALMAALARAPRLGRPRPAPASHADQPAQHALALGALLAQAGSAPEAHELLERYRRWRHPRSSQGAPPRPPTEPGQAEARSKPQPPPSSDNEPPTTNH